MAVRKFTTAGLKKKVKVAPPNASELTVASKDLRKGDKAAAYAMAVKSAAVRSKKKKS